MIISKTPVRISFFGGGTDYPSYYLNHGGAVLGTTINKYIYLSLNQLSPFFDYKIRIGYSKSELINSIDEIQHPSIRECLKYYDLHEGLDIHIFADLPARTGLGSSSAFTVGFLNALDMYLGKENDKASLAKRALYVEQELIKEKVGSQDQCHAAYGGLNLIEFSKEDPKVTSLYLSNTKQDFLDQSLMLFFTGVKRYAEDILDEQIKKTESKANNIYLQQMHEMVFEAQNILQDQEGDELLRQLGALMHESWQKKKLLSSKISNEHVDKLYQTALKAGAYGGKLCGAGLGGFLLLLVPKEKQAHVRAQLAPLMEVNFNFDEEGSQIIYQNIRQEQGLSV